MKRIAIADLQPVALVDDGGDVSKTTLVFSSGRSGSTLVMNILNYAGELRTMFEPFRHVVPGAQPFAFRHVQPHDERPALIAHMTAVLSGRLQHPWMDQLNSPRRYAGRVVKCIRLNLAAKWIARHFPGVPMIHLVRHPFAVAVSTMQQGWTLPPTIERDKTLRDQFPVIGKISVADLSPFERTLYWWCVENYVPLVELDEHERFLLWYENLFLHRRETLEQLFAFARLPYGPEADRVLDRPSETTGRRQFNDCWTPRYWESRLSAAECARGADILALFGLDQLYLSGAVPNPAFSRDLLPH